MGGGTKQRGASVVIGRPRDPSLQARVLDAVTALLDTTGVQGVSMATVAERAGVPKSTIYRRWPSKSMLLADALREVFNRREPEPDTGSVRDDLRLLVAEHARLFASPPGRLVVAMMVEAQRDAELRDVVRDLVATRRAFYGAALEKGVARGEIRDDVVLERVVDMLVGAVWMRMASSMPVTPRVIDSIIDVAWDGIAPR